MKITFLGAAGEVTGSCYLVEADGERLMLDCGMFQGEGSEEKNRRVWPEEAKKLVGVVLTHAHLDHCGRLPWLVRSGYGGMVWVTPATKELAEIVLVDAAKIAADNKKAEPLYTTEDAVRTVEMMRVVDYNKEQKVGENFKFIYLDAGHILGSASVVLKVKDGGKERVVVFSGALG